MTTPSGPPINPFPNPNPPTNATSLFDGVRNWFKSKGGFSHVAFAVFTTLMLAYTTNPQFHAYVLQLHAMMPAWAQELITEALAFYAWYRNNNKTPAS